MGFRLKIKTYKVKDLPVAVVKEFYTKKQLEQIMNFVFTTNPYEWFTNPDKNGGAKDEKGNNLKNNYAVCVDEWYTQTGRTFCPLFKINRKLWDKKFNAVLEKEHYIFKNVMSVNADTTFLNYYEDSNFYDYHTDKATITALTIFYQEPKRFEGGELLFESELTVPCENNSLVIFPSILKHRAETIKMKTKEKLCGRFSMTQFLRFI
jgi:hypothetical protein